MPTCPLCPATPATFRGVGVHLARSHPGPDGALARFARFTEPDGECLLWTGQLDDYGYGHFTIGRSVAVAHRWAYEQQRGAVPAGHVLDHLCKTRRCVRVSHLEAVTQRENLRRSDNHVGRHLDKTTCDNGHPYTADSVRLLDRGTYVERVCRPCKAEWAARRRAAGRR